MTTNCAYCKKQIERPRYRIRPRNYCNNSHKLRYEYENNLRDPIEITRAAHAAVKGHHFPNRDWSFLARRNKSAEMRRKNSEWHKAHNPMSGRVGALHHRFKGGKIWWRGKEWDTLKKKIRERDHDCCVNCGLTNDENIKKFGAPLQVDHIIPYRETKDNSMGNLQTLCNKCHGDKCGRGL